MIALFRYHVSIKPFYNPFIHICKLNTVTVSGKRSFMIMYFLLYPGCNLSCTQINSDNYNKASCQTRSVNHPHTDLYSNEVNVTHYTSLK